MLISCLVSSICIMITSRMIKEKDRMLLNAEKGNHEGQPDARHVPRSAHPSYHNHRFQFHLSEPGGTMLTRRKSESWCRTLKEDAQWLLNMVENLLRYQDPGRAAWPM